MARKDIEIRIKARDEASRNAKKVADALKALGTTGDNLGTTGAKVGGAMSAIGDGLGKLQGKLGGIDNLGKLVTKLNETTGTVAKLEKELAESQRTLDQQTQKQRAAAQVSADLKARLEAETAAQKQRAERLKEMTNARNKDTKSVLDAARAAEKLQKIVDGGKGGYSGPRYQRKGVGVEAGAPFKSARESFGAFLQPEIDAGLGGKAALTAQVNALKAANDASKTSITALRNEIKAASAEERGFTSDTEKAAAQIERLNGKLLEATGAWAKLDDEAGAAAKELGGIALSQEAVAKATSKAKDELQKQAATLAAYERLSTKRLRGGGTIADTTELEAAEGRKNALKQAREEVRLLREEQMRLDATLRQGDGNTLAQVESMNRMTRAVKLAEEQVRKLEIQQRLAQGAGASGFAKWAKVYNPIVTGAQTAVQAQEHLNQSTRKSVAEAGKIAPMAQRNTGALRNQAGATNQASNAIVKLGRDTRTTLSFMQRMRGEVLAMTSGFLGFYAALNRGQKAMDAFMAVQKAENRLGVALKGDTAKVAKEITFLNAEADRLGFTFESLADGYGKISVAASNAGFSVADTREIFTSLAEAARVNGSSMDEMNGVLKALDQMMSKGKVQAEELRGQLGDRMSGAFKMFADGLGMTTAQLDEAMKKGEVYADRETLLKFARRLTKAYGDQVPKAMQGLAASLGTFDRDMEKVNLALSNGFVPAVQAALKSFNAFVNSAEGLDTFRSMGEAAGKLIGVLALIPQNFDLISTAAQALIAVAVGRALSSMAKSALTARNNFITLTTSMVGATAPTTRLGAAQRTLSMGVRQTSFALAIYEARLRSSTSSNAIARAGTLGLAATVGGLRNVMLVTAGVARTMWAAIGGPIGAAALAVSMIISGWSTSADKATIALETHEKHLQAVRTAYADVGEGVDDWAKKIKGLTELDARQSVAKLEAQYEAALSGIARRARTIQNLVQQNMRAGDVAKGPYRDEINELNKLVKGFMEGNVELGEFKRALSDLALKSTSSGVRDLAVDLNKIVDETDDAGKSVGDYAKALQQARAILKILTQGTDEASEATLELERSTDRSNATFGRTKLLKEYSDAIDELKGKIPSLSGEMKRLKDITELNATAWEAMSKAWKTGELDKIINVLTLWGKGMGDLAIAKNNAMLDSYGAANSDVMKRIIAIEGGQTGDGPNTSSARGIGQFTNGTWLRYIDRLYPELRTLNETQKLSLRTSEEHAFKILEAFTRDNQTQLLQAGLSAGPAETYLAHFLGAGDATKVLKASMDTLVKDVVQAQSIRANPAVFKDGMTVRDLINWSQRKMRPAQGETDTRILRGNRDLVNAEIIARQDTEDGKRAAERQQAVAAAIRDARVENPFITKEELDKIAETETRLWNLRNPKVDREKNAAEENAFQIRQAELQTQKLEKQAAVEAALRSALLEKRQLLGETAALTEAETARITEQAAALWQANNPRYELLRIEEQISHLQSRRDELQKQRDLAIEMGDNGKAVSLKAEITEINGQLQTAAEKAIAMWAAIGGPEADAAIAKLKTMGVEIKKGENQIGLFGLSMQTWQGVFDSAINGLVGAFDAMAQAIAQGENAFQAFGKAVLQTLAQVLQQIAVAIIRMQILKMLQGFGGGIGQFATAALGGMTGHTGGVVGSMAIGAGNSIRSAGWVQSALTYHTGGIAGLRPDEVSATLKKGEEILTEEDPRHRDNLGGESRGSQGTRLTQVLAIGDSEIANAMKGKSGQDVTLTHIKRNAPTIKRMLGV